MKPTLIRTNGTRPPGEFQFRDSITGKFYKEPEFEVLIGKIVRDRNANRRLIPNAKYVDAVYVARKVSEQNCERLRNDPVYCVGGVPPQNNLSSSPPAPLEILKDKACKWCGAFALTEIICLPCSGRLIGYQCGKCNRMTPK